MPADPERARLAAEALARARADAWARGERPGKKDQDHHPERTAPAASPADAAGWSARPRRDDPQPLTEALGGLLAARGWRDRAAVGVVFGDWPRVVGAQLAAHTRPESFDDGELTVSADSSAWAAQLRLLAPQLLKRLGEELGHGVVHRIKVRGQAGPPKPRLRAR
jgi:predicted nucleic acid-binding Zn ribbon protein